MNGKEKEDLIDLFEDISEKESGISVGKDDTDSGDDLVDDLDDVNKRTVELPFSTEDEKEEDFSGADIEAADLVDDLENGEAEEEDSPETEVNTEESFAPSKKIDKSKKTMQITALVAGAILFGIVLFLPDSEKKKKGGEEESGRINTDEILRDMKNYSGSDMRKKEERRSRQAMPDVPLENKKPVAEDVSSSTPRPVRRQGGAGANYHKDREILEKYARVDPGAASGGTPARQGGLLNVPARSGQGGINIISRKEKEEKEKEKSFNIEVKAALNFGVRSSSGDSVVATLKESKGDFTEGSVFYGTANFNNKRTYIKFTHAVVDGERVTLSGRAMVGRDPGIPSEVTEIAGDNADSSLKSGALGVAGKVADNALSTATKGVTSGVLADSTKDLQDQHQKDKKQYEYFVPASTTFTIYIY